MYGGGGGDEQSDESWKCEEGTGVNGEAETRAREKYQEHPGMKKYTGWEKIQRVSWGRGGRQTEGKRQTAEAKG